MIFISMFHLSKLYMYSMSLLMFCNIPVNSFCILTVLCPRRSHKDHKYLVKDITVIFNSINDSFPKRLPLFLEKTQKTPNYFRMSFFSIV